MSVIDRMHKPTDGGGALFQPVSCLNSEAEKSAASVSQYKTFAMDSGYVNRNGEDIEMELLSQQSDRSYPRKSCCARWCGWLLFFKKRRSPSVDAERARFSVVI